jgi:hypothetical protein
LSSSNNNEKEGDIITLIGVVIAVTAVLIAKTSTLWATEYSFVNFTKTYFEDGSGIIIFDNGTERHFTHNITSPASTYQHGEIYHSSNLSGVLLE